MAASIQLVKVKHKKNYSICVSVFEKEPGNVKCCTIAIHVCVVSCRELREPLYYLATKLETLTKEVIRACRNAAKDYEEKLRERKIVK